MKFQKYRFLIPPGKGDSDEAIQLLDVSPPEINELLGEITSCHFTIDLTLNDKMNVSKKSISAQRTFFIEVIRHLMSVNTPKKGNIIYSFIVFEAQVNTGNLHIHCNVKLNKPEYKTAKMIDIKKRLINIYNFHNAGMDISSIRYSKSRTAYLLKCKTKYPDYVCSLIDTTDKT